MRTKARMRADGVTDVERPWMELVKDRGPIVARDLLVEQGINPARAAGMAIWLCDQADGVRIITDKCALRYRAELRELTPPDYAANRAIPG
jgi:hypothetical protein